MDRQDINEDDIRIPDDVVVDQLMEDNRSDFEKQIDEAIYLSMQDINKQQVDNVKYEAELLNEYKNETKKREDIFKTLLIDLKKLSNFDKEVREIYNIIDAIITSYCSQSIKICELDPETYNAIFTVLGKIRTDKNAVEILKTIIVVDDFCEIRDKLMGI